MTLCVVCPVFRPAAKPRLPDFPPVCDGCRERVRSELSEIPDLYALIPGELEPTSTAGAKVSGTKAAPLPVRLDALNLLVGATGGDGVIEDPDRDQVGAIPPVVVLDQWARDWIEYGWCRGEHLPPPTVASLASWMLVRLNDALDHHSAIDEFARELNKALRDIRAVVQTKKTGEPVGRCPSKLNDDSRCNTRLFADPYLDLISCGRCGTSWTRSGQGWIHLRALQQQWDDRNTYGDGEAA